MIMVVCILLLVFVLCFLLGGYLIDQESPHYIILTKQKQKQITKYLAACDYIIDHKEVTHDKFEWDGHYYWILKYKDNEKIGAGSLNQYEKAVICFIKKVKKDTENENKQVTHYVNSITKSM